MSFSALNLYNYGEKVIDSMPLDKFTIQSNVNAYTCLKTHNST